MRSPGRIEAHLTLEKMFKWLQNAPDEASYKRRMAIWLTHTGRLTAGRVADIIGVSALLTTTMVGQKKAVEILEEKGFRDKFKVLLGGAPVTVSWVEECKADGFAENAVEAISAAKSLLDSL